MVTNEGHPNGIFHFDNLSTLACEDAYSKLVEVVVTVVDVDRVGNSLLQILNKRFRRNAKFLFRL